MLRCGKRKFFPKDKSFLLGQSLNIESTLRNRISNNHFSQLLFLFDITPAGGAIFNKNVMQFVIFTVCLKIPLYNIS